MFQAARPCVIRSRVAKRRATSNGSSAPAPSAPAGVAELRSAGHAVEVARYRASRFVRLAMLRGSGVSQAERWVKDPARGARYAVSEDGALHGEKYYNTVREEFAWTRPAFRWRQLVALARVTASECGRPAPGIAEARELLKV